MTSKIISPSILACDFLNIAEEISHFEGLEDVWLHLDVMDSHFVPNLTFGHEIINKISKVTKVPLDAHCMVSNPDFFVDTFKDFNLCNFTFHYEACDNPLKIAKEAKKHYPSIGISIKPNTEPDVLTDEMLKTIDLVLVMSVEPGFGGQSFMENSYDKIKDLKRRREELGTSFSIQVDGGVSNKNASQLFSAGADNLVAGSYIFKAKAKAKDYKTKIDSLRG